MKSAIIVALALCFGLVVFFYHRRLKLAVLVAGVLAVLLTAVRLVLLRDDVDRVTELGLVLAVMFGVWLVTNLVTHLLQRYRRRQAPR